MVDSSKLFGNSIGKAMYKLVQPAVEQVMGIRKLNRAYKLVKDRDPVDFCKSVLRVMGVKASVDPAQLIALREIQGPIVVVANHPFGGLEAMVFIQLLAEIRPEYKVMANFLLSQISELQDIIIPVNPFGTREALIKNVLPMKQTLEYLKAGGLVGVFPAGEVSSFNLKAGAIRDPDWNPIIARLIQKSGATVVPVYFDGHNSMLFQMAGLIHPRLRTSLLVREFVHPPENEIRFTVGKPISPGKLAAFRDAEQMTLFLKSKTYFLGTRFHKTRNRFNLDTLKIFDQPKVPETVIPPVPLDVIQREIEGLSREQVLAERENFVVFGIYQRHAPNLIREVGRLRETAFRAVGEGSGNSCDTDGFDSYYLHLILWDRQAGKVAGGYRLGRGDHIMRQYGKQGFYTFSLFRVRNRLLRQLNPALEMGRSFVSLDYQRNFMPLMLLWSAIGAYVVRNPQYKFLFGPVSISADLNDSSRALLVSFLEQNEMDNQLLKLVKPRKKFRKKATEIGRFYNALSVSDLSDVQALIAEVEQSGMGVPILLKHYLKLGGKLLAFNVDPDFSDVLDGLILVDLTQTDPVILKRYMGEEGLKKFREFHGLT